MAEVVVSIAISALGFLQILVTVVKERGLPAQSEDRRGFWTAFVLASATLLLGVTNVAITHRAKEEGRRQAREDVHKEDALVIDQQKQRIDQLQNVVDSYADQQKQQSEQQFSTTLTQVSGVLRQARAAVDLSAKNLASITGVDSYPCIVPDIMAADGELMPFSIWNRGPNPLTGVEVSITNLQSYRLNRMNGIQNSTYVGTLSHEWAKSLPAITPELDSTGVASYTAQIWTQNGFYDEVINFRPSRRPGVRWAYEYWLSKQVPLTKLSPGMPKGALGQLQPVLMSKCQREWSDE